MGVLDFNPGFTLKYKRKPAMLAEDKIKQQTQIIKDRFDFKHGGSRKNKKKRR